MAKDVIMREMVSQKRVTLSFFRQGIPDYSYAPSRSSFESLKGALPLLKVVATICWMAPRSIRTVSGPDAASDYHLRQAEEYLRLLHGVDQPAGHILHAARRAVSMQ
jgi:hypothetical protein